jgi:signal peptidase I
MEEGTFVTRASLPSWLRTAVIGRNPRFTFVRVIVLVVTAFVVFRFILLPIRVKGPSMFPTYRDGGINFVNRLAYLHSEPKRGDVVAIRLAGPSVMYMKRIVGLPGETVGFHEGHLYINDKPMDEPYVKLRCDWESPPMTLPPDHYYVVGDNRSMPKELHEEGDPHRSRIVGKVLLCKSWFVSWLP